MSVTCKASTGRYCVLRQVETLENAAYELRQSSQPNAVQHSGEIMALAQKMRSEGVLCGSAPCTHASGLALACYPGPDDPRYRSAPASD